MRIKNSEDIKIFLGIFGPFILGLLVFVSVWVLWFLPWSEGNRGLARLLMVAIALCPIVWLIANLLWFWLDATSFHTGEQVRRYPLWGDIVATTLISIGASIFFATNYLKDGLTFLDSPVFWFPLAVSLVLGIGITVFVFWLIYGRNSY